METKYFFAKVKSINETERTLDAVASTSALDRDNDIILPSAFAETIEAFKANPVILATHQHRLSTGSSPVIGSAVPESIVIGDKIVTFTMRFAGTPLGDEYWQLYRDKHMRAFSIGFIPLEHEDQKDEHLGYVRTYTKIELLEISAVPVPSNRQALVRAKGFFEAEDIRSDIAETVKAVTEQVFKDQLDKFVLRIEDRLDQFESVIVDSDGFANSLLCGGGFEPSAPDDKTTAALKQLERIENIVISGKEQCASNHKL